MACVDGFRVAQPILRLLSGSAVAASVKRVRNQDCAGSPVERRCHAIDTVVAKSIGNGVIAIAAFAAICSAMRRGTVAIRSEAATAAGTAK